MAVAAPNNRSDAADCRSDPGRHERWTETVGMRIRPSRFRCVGRAHWGSFTSLARAVCGTGGAQLLRGGETVNLQGKYSAPPQPRGV
eukprot:962331-Prymnesium_polylepis.1